MKVYAVQLLLATFALANEALAYRAIGETLAYRGTTPKVHAKPTYSPSLSYNNKPENPVVPSYSPTTYPSKTDNATPAKKVYTTLVNADPSQSETLSINYHPPSKSDYPSPKHDFDASNDYQVEENRPGIPVFKTDYYPNTAYSGQDHSFKPNPQNPAPVLISNTKLKYAEEAFSAPLEPYSFGFIVKDDYDDYSRQESSDGKVVTGSYHVQLPDGRKQIVTYSAGAEGGYKADVKYEGDAKYPETPNRADYKSQQTYKPQEPHVEPEYKPVSRSVYSPPDTQHTTQ